MLQLLLQPSRYQYSSIRFSSVLRHGLFCVLVVWYIRLLLSDEMQVSYRCTASQDPIPHHANSHDRALNSKYTRPEPSGGVGLQEPFICANSHRLHLLKQALRASRMLCNSGTYIVTVLRHAESCSAVNRYQSRYPRRQQ